MRFPLLSFAFIALIGCATPYATLDGLTLTEADWEKAFTEDPSLSEYEFPTFEDAEFYANHVAQELLMERHEWREIEESGLLNEPVVQDRLQIVDIAAAAAWIRDFQFADQCEITEDVARAFYDSHPEQFTFPDGIRFRHIAQDEDAVDLANNLVDTLRADPERFVELAQEHDQSLNPRPGETFGPIRPEDINPQIAEVLWALQPGETGDPLTLGGNIHLLQVVERFQRNLPFDRVDGQIIANLKQECIDSLSDDALAMAVSDLAITVHPIPETLTPETPLLSGGVNLTVGDLSQKLGRDLSQEPMGAPLTTYLSEFMEDHIFAAFVAAQDLGDERLDKLRRDIRKDILFRIMAERRVDAIPPLEEHQVRQRYRNLADSQYTEPVRLQIRNLVLNADEDSTPAALHRRAIELRAAWEAGADFGELIAEHSDEPEQIQWIYPAGDDVVPYRSTGTLATGEVSQPIQVGHRVILVQALARQERYLRPFEEVADEIRELLPRIIAESNEQRHWLDLRNSVEISLPDEAIQEFISEDPHSHNGEGAHSHDHSHIH